MENQYPIQQLFIKYLENRCTANEIKQLLDYFENEQDEDLLRSLIQSQINLKNQYEENESNAEVELTKIRSALIDKINEDLDKKPFRIVSFSRWLKISAIWVVLAGVCALLIKRSQQDFKNVANPSKLLTIVSGPGQRKYIILSDSSKIWLSPSSSLTYPDQFNGNLREVKLEGEAFFQVAKDKKHPFIIHSGLMSTRVVGTSFDIQSYKSQNKFLVTVLTGVVKVSDYDKSHSMHNEVILYPMQRSIMNTKNGDLTSLEYPDAEEILKRKNGILVYNGRPVQEVAADLSNYYNISIELNSKSRQGLCFGEFNTNKPIEVVLEQLATAINANVIFKNGKYVINGGRGYNDK